MAAAKIGEAADQAEDLAEIVRSLPGNRECRDRAGAGAADAMALGILGEVVLLVECRHELVDDDAGVFVVERVVFSGPVGRPIAPLLRRRFRLFRRSTRVDEHRQHHRQLPAIDQVVEHVGDAQVALHVLERLAVVEDHQARRDRFVVLRRHVHPIRVLRTWISLARQREWPADVAFRDPLAFEGVRAELIVRVRIRGRWRGRGRLRGCRRLRREHRSRRDGEHKRRDDGRESCHMRAR